MRQSLQGLTRWARQLYPLRFINKKTRLTSLVFYRFAERTGFEPANQFCRLHAFQACLFNHSSTSPMISFRKSACKITKKS